jgi:hypothetical protein
MIDYDKVFAPVARSRAVRLFFSIVASEDLECHMLDIKIAFLKGEVDSVIDMSQPHGFHDGTGNVSKLRKFLQLWSEAGAPCLEPRSISAFYRMYPLPIRWSIVHSESCIWCVCVHIC